MVKSLRKPIIALSIVTVLCLVAAISALLARQMCLLGRDPLPIPSGKQCLECGKPATFSQPPEYIFKRTFHARIGSEAWNNYNEAVKRNQFRYFCDQHTVSFRARWGVYIGSFLLVLFSMGMLYLWLEYHKRRLFKAIVALLSAALLATIASAIFGHLSCTLYFAISAPSGKICDRCERTAVYEKPGVAASSYSSHGGFESALEALDTTYYCSLHATSFRHFPIHYALVFIVAFFAALVAIYWPRESKKSGDAKGQE